MVDFNEGYKLANRYELVETIGQGSMGHVYRARDLLLGGVPVAVKFLSQALLSRSMRDRFEQEATTCALLGQKSIHVVRVTDYGVDAEEVPFYVMEYLKGKSLNEVITPKPLPVPRFLDFCRQICLGLQCAHRGIPVKGQIIPIIHRDIKPSNIIVSQDSSLGELVKILDFGIAKLMQADSGQTNSFMGTLAYSSPEQMEGRELDSRSDIYSLGIMMFQMLTGKMPLRAESHTFGGWYKAHHFKKPRSFQEVNPNLQLPKLMENLVMKCLAKDPCDRPQSANDILRELEPLGQRFGTGMRLSQRIENAISNLPVTKKLRPDTEVSADKICRLASWPKSKPIAEIVFPHILQTSQASLCTLWVMLKKHDIENRLICTRYNHFLCTMVPHPMILWITAIYSREHGPRWLPCYLDLKTPQGQEIARLLGKMGQYRILAFALGEPRCANVLTSNVAPPMGQMLQDWANMGQMQTTAGQASISKNMLKTGLEELKPKILMKLESLNSDFDSPTEMSD
ncbi:MAG: serine/threonine protein kinase [Cyanothece sp. SIO1E1]|nr:serine/threonine protein kinase [Cyanothece sp. SIO1E1]